MTDVTKSYEVEGDTGVGTHYGAGIDQGGMNSISVGWLDKWVNGNSLSYTSLELSILIKSLERDAIYSQDFLLAQKDLRKGVREISELMAKGRLLPDQVDGSSLRSRLMGYYRKASDFSERTCQILLHYQQVFDVFKEQAPEYVTAIWGAVKLLLLVVHNKTHIKEQIERNLIDFVGKFQLLDIITKFPPSQDVQKAITQSIQVFLTFLTKSIQFMKKNGFRQAFSGLVKPWKIQFEPLAEDVSQAILRARELARVYFERNTGLLVHATYKDQQTLGKAIFEFAKKLDLRSDTLEESVQTLITLVQTREKPPILASTHEIKAIKADLEDEVDRRQGLEVVGTDEKTIFRQTTKGVPITVLIQQEGKTLSECFEQVFPGVSTYDLQPQVFSRYHLYHHRQGKADVETLCNLENERGVQDWLTSLSSAILWVHGHRQLASFDWMTRFSLRVIYPTLPDDLEVGRPMPPTQLSTMFTLHIFCGLLLRSGTIKKLSVCGLLHSLIVQAFARLWSLESIDRSPARQQSIKSRNDCQDLGLVIHQLEEGKDDPKSLIEILSSLLRLIDSTCVFIVIDGIHHLHDEGMKDSRLTPDFRQLLSSLAELTADSDFRVKTLVTSRAPFTSDIMAAEVVRYDVKFHGIKVDRQAVIVSRTPSRVERRRVRLEQDDKINEAHQRRVQESLEAGDDSILDHSIDQDDLLVVDGAESEAGSLGDLDSSDSEESIYFTSDEEGDKKPDPVESNEFGEGEDSEDSDSTSEAMSPKLNFLKQQDSLEDLMISSRPSSPIGELTHETPVSDAEVEEKSLVDGETKVLANDLSDDSDIKPD